MNKTINQMSAHRLRVELISIVEHLSNTERDGKVKLIDIF